MKKTVFSLIGVVLLTFSLNAKDAKELIKENNCMSCHNEIGPKDAPSFKGIARRNIRWYGIEETKMAIKNTILNGSRGKYRKFLGKEMPLYNLTEEDLNTLTEYIISLNDVSYRGNHNK